jgi:hypothetical protein
MTNPHIPLSDRTIGELRARADELREMARPARTADVQSALRMLADRFTVLADARR